MGRGFETHFRHVVSLSKTIYSSKIPAIPKKKWLRPDMTEIVDWNVKPQHKQTKQTQAVHGSCCAMMT